MGVELSQKVLDFLDKNGPSLPIRVANAIGGNTLFAGAILSELAARKVVLVSYLKVGGSPLYYLPKHKAKLADYKKYLSERPKLMFDILKDSKVVYERSCEAWQRVALREDLKDFAYPFEIEINNSKEKFWRWYLIPEDDAKRIVMDLVNKQAGKEGDVKAEPKENSIKKEAVEDNKGPGESDDKTKDTEEVKEKAKVEKTEEKPEKKAETEVKSAAKEDKPKEEQKTLTRPKLNKKDGSEFYNNIFEFFTENDIKIINEEKGSKKTKDLFFEVEIPSQLGGLRYMVVAKNKKKISESDLSLAFSNLFHKKLPLIYVSNGELTKGAKRLLDDQLKGIIFKKI